ncbi:class I SAM-dependent methyltransferase [Streptomyces mirabilis]|uniref:class I SAM-dependent methyltransferase n=1 Tax=Streptomyces mirabilis TaxID=68239 RepID=UPI0036CA9FF0
MRRRVVEIGAGTGANFRHYPLEVTQVVAVEPKPRLRAHVEKAATDAPVQVEVAAGRAEQLPSEDDGFDVAVFSLVLCTFADVPGALAEARRVLKPGGKLLFYEHVGSERPGFPPGVEGAGPPMAAHRWRLPPHPRHRTRHPGGGLHRRGHPPLSTS